MKLYLELWKLGFKTLCHPLMALFVCGILFSIAKEVCQNSIGHLVVLL